MRKLFFCIFFVVFSSLYSFDIKNPSRLDYSIGYGHGKLEKQKDYTFSLFAVDFVYPLKKNFEFELEPFASYLYTPDKNFEGGVSFFFRYNFGRRKIQPYIKGGSGIIYISQDTYEQATNFNFVSQICAGFSFSSQKGKIGIEYRYRHISNAGIKKPNSGINSQIYLLTFSLPF